MLSRAQGEELLKGTFILTEREKVNFLQNLEQGDQTVNTVLRDFSIHKDVTRLYEDLKNYGLLPGQVSSRSYQVNNFTYAPQQDSSITHVPEYLKNSTHSNMQFLNSSSNQPKSHSNLDGEISMQTIPIIKMFNALMSPDGIGCDKTHFSYTLKRLLPDEPTSDLSLNKLFNQLDSNRDGYLSVDELGRGLCMIYKNDDIDPDSKALWSNITPNNALGAYSFKDRLMAICQEDTEQVYQIYKDLNPEENQDVSFWQFLRARNTQGGCKLVTLLSGNNRGSVSGLFKDRWGGSTSKDYGANLFTSNRMSGPDIQESTVRTGTVTKKEKQVSSGVKFKEQSGLGVDPFKNFKRARRVLNLNRISAIEIAQFLKAEMQQGPTQLSEKEFCAMIKKLLPIQLGEKQLKSACGSLFKLMDQDNTKSLDRTELANGLIILGEGTKPQKIEAAFYFYDWDNSGKLDINELTDYFLGTLKLKQVLLQHQPSLAKTGDDLSEEEKAKIEKDKIFGALDFKNLHILAAATAKSVFKVMDQNSDGKIELYEFQQYVLKRNTPFENVKPESQNEINSQVGNGSSRKARVAKRKSHVGSERKFDPTVLVQEIRNSIALEKVHIKDAFDFFTAGRVNNQINKAQFKERLIKLVDQRQINLKFDDAIEIVPQAFFNVFDMNKNGLLDQREISVGLFILAGGHQREKLKLIAEVFDSNNDGMVVKAELCLFYQLFFKFVHMNNPQADPLTLAQDLTNQTFEELGNPVGLTYDQWSLWQSRVK